MLARQEECAVKKMGPIAMFCSREPAFPTLKKQNTGGVLRGDDGGGPRWDYNTKEKKDVLGKSVSSQGLETSMAGRHTYLELPVADRVPSRAISQNFREWG